MEDTRKIEKSITKKFRKEIFSKVVRAVKEYHLIEDNDVVAVCISGGKDSFLLAKCLEELKRHRLIKFDLKFLVMNPGYEKDNIDKILENAKKLNLDLTIFESNIFDVISKQKSGSECYLCARMRRGHLYSKAKELGCNKIALGHHFNDVIETIMMNILYNGVFSSMLPILNSDNFEGMKLIRPLYLIKESDIISWSKYNELTFLDCACNVTKKSIGKRKEIKKLIEELVNVYKNIDINIFNSMKNVNMDTLLGCIDYDGNKHNLLDEKEIDKEER